MLYFRQPNEDEKEPNLVFWAAWWLAGRGKKYFGRSDSEPFSRWALRRGVVIAPPSDIAELIDWCHRNLVGLQVARRDGPDPFLRN